MKRIRILMATLPLLIAVCLMSTGFAGWVSVKNAEAIVSGGFTGYDVIDSDDVISTSGSQIFSIKAESFVNTSGINQDYGEISVPYSIDLTKCSSNDITVHLSLSYEGLAANDKALFVKPADRTDGYTYQYTIDVGVDTDGDGVADISATGLAATENATVTANGITVTNGGTYISADIDMSVAAGSGTTAFTVIYRFNIPKNLAGDGVVKPLNFRECFGKYLKVTNGSQTEFVTTAWVEEKASQ